MTRKTILLFLLIAIIAVAKADVKLTSVFADHMVLQQGQNVMIWGTASPGEKISVSILKQKVKSVADADGKWMVKLSPLSASVVPTSLVIAGNNTISINDILIGEVWLCSGQSNMDMTVAKEDRYWCGVHNEAEEVAAANYPNIRVFDTDYSPRMEAQTDVVGKWELCSPQTVGHFSAAAYFFAVELQKKYNVPVGLITTAYGASTAEAWISKTALEPVTELKFLLEKYDEKLSKFYADSAVSMPTYREKMSKWEGDVEALKAAAGDVSSNVKLPRAPKNPDPRVDQHNPYVLYNGMVAPLIPYTIKGALWYQGESNTPTADIYDKIMELLIADWRTRWGLNDFPFIYVQLANYKDLVTEPVKEDATVLVRDAQLRNLSVKNTAMVVAIDNADAWDYKNIHPKNKQEIGHRFAVAAEAIAYGEKQEYMGPIYQSMHVEGEKIRIHFTHVGKGLESKSDTLKGFAICASDKQWVWGNASIEGNSVVVTSPDVKEPVAVRYGWAINPITGLYNKEGFPASPFKTDKE